MLRSLTGDGEFARMFLQGMPTHLNHWMAACVQAAIADGDAYAGPVQPNCGLLVCPASGSDDQDLRCCPTGRADGLWTDPQNNSSSKPSGSLCGAWD